MTDSTYVTVHDLVQKVLAGFDFERIHKIMVAVDWKWSLGSGPDSCRVPDLEDLRSQAERLLCAAVRDADTISSGGFKAAFTVSHGRAILSLVFEAASYWADC
jgi:hypothetical protein